MGVATHVSKDESDASRLEKQRPIWIRCRKHANSNSAVQFTLHSGLNFPASDRDKPSKSEDELQTQSF
jgi:hypothetical protein